MRWLIEIPSDGTNPAYLQRYRTKRQATEDAKLFPGSTVWFEGTTGRLFPVQIGKAR